MSIKHLPMLFVLLSVGAIHIGCDDDSSAQVTQIPFTETYSGAFITGPASTDTNDDGRPASLATLVGTSTFGAVVIESANEFALLEAPVTCPEGNLEFTLVRGNFVKRTDSGDLLFGQWNTGISCFDPETETSNTTQIGIFVGGTGEFSGVTGPIRIDFTSTFLANSADDGFIFGGASGTGEGTVEFP